MLDRNGDYDMKIEEQFLLQVIDAYINNKKIILPSNIVLKNLYEISEKHCITAIVCSELEGELEKNNDQETVQLFRNAAIVAVCRNNTLDYYAQCLIDELESKKITYAFVKGYSIKNDYPEPEFRTMGDLDVLINIQDRECVDNILKHLGYERGEFGGNVWVYTHGNVTFEIHTKLVAGKFWNNVDYESYFEKIPFKLKSSKNEYRKYLSVEDHFLFLCFHFAKHLYESGAGIRMLLDISIYVKKYGEKMDWEYIWKESDVIQMREFIENLLYVCKEWFHINLNTAYKKVDSEVLPLFAEYIFSGGIFGFDRDESIRRLRKGINESNLKQKNGIKINAVIKFLFPDWKHMIWFLPEIEKHKFLLPIAWVKRWIMEIGRRNKVKHSLEGLSKNMDEAKAHFILLKKIGL